MKLFSLEEAQFDDEIICPEGADKAIRRIGHVQDVNAILIFLKGVLMVLIILVLVIYILRLNRRKCFEFKILGTMAISYGILAFLFGK